MDFFMQYTWNKNPIQINFFNNYNMPEGPEVKIITDELAKRLVGKYLTNISILAGRYKTHGPPKNYEKMIQLLPLKILSINAYGKFIWWEFADTDLTLWNTLGMTGWWQLKKEPHNNIEFFYKRTLTSGKLSSVYFNDQRNFGTFIFDTKKNLEKKLGEFGPDILSLDKKTSNRFYNLVKDKSKAICEILLEQKITAGCGNYLRADALYLAEINPFTLAKDLSEKKIKELWNILNQLAWFYYNKTQGIKNKIIDGKYKFADSFDRVFLIYSQTTDPLGNKVKKEQVKDRTIHWVQTLQTI
jgi:DNA-formamidopyrimidine glycosylase